MSYKINKPFNKRKINSRTLYAVILNNWDFMTRTEY